MKYVNLEAYRNVIEYIKDINNYPLTELTFVDNEGKHITVSAEDAKDWHYTGLSNKSYIEDHLL